MYDKRNQTALKWPKLRKMVPQFKALSKENTSTGPFIPDDPLVGIFFKNKGGHLAFQEILSNCKIVLVILQIIALLYKHMNYRVFQSFLLIIMLQMLSIYTQK